MTFFVVMLVLAPMLCTTGQNGYYLMLCTGVLPVTHLLGPLLTFGSYVFLEAERSMTLRQSIAGLVPTLLYGLVAYPCNIARIWDGPYPFFRVWEMPAWHSVLWFIALLVMAFALSQIPRLLGRRLSRRS